MSTTVTYEGSTIATVNNNTKTLQTAGKYLTDNITLVDVTQSGGITPSGTKQISISTNGTTTEDVTSYASAEIAVNVPQNAADLITKVITANGTYNASSDNADGYSSVTVNVPAPAPLGMTLDWADVQEITIGENSVKNASEMQSYLSSYTYTFLILKDALTVNNQLVFAGSNNLGTSITTAYRCRNNTIGSFGITASYDCKLVEGSVYYAITKKTS